MPSGCFRMLRERPKNLSIAPASAASANQDERPIGLQFSTSRAAPTNSPFTDTFSFILFSFRWFPPDPNSALVRIIAGWTQEYLNLATSVRPLIFRLDVTKRYAVGVRRTDEHLSLVFGAGPKKRVFVRFSERLGRDSTFCPV